jgi:hypothetical protein
MQQNRICHPIEFLKFFSIFHFPSPFAKSTILKGEYVCIAYSPNRPITCAYAIKTLFSILNSCIPFDLCFHRAGFPHSFFRR